MEVDGCDKLQTDQAEASKPWCVLLRILLYTLILRSVSCRIYLDPADDRRTKKQTHEK